MTRLVPRRQQLIAPGQVADCIYLISHGELEIFSPVCPAGSDLSLSEPLISGLDLAQLQEQADPDVWDSTPVSDISKEPGGERAGGCSFLFWVAPCKCRLCCVVHGTVSDNGKY